MQTKQTNDFPKQKVSDFEKNMFFRWNPNGAPRFAPFCWRVQPPKIEDIHRFQVYTMGPQNLHGLRGFYGK